MKEVRIFSFGGGIQSVAAAVLAQRKEINFSTFIFANVGEDSENPATLEYIEKYMKPFFAHCHHLSFIEVRKHLRSGEEDTVLRRIMRENRSIGIPVYMSNGAPSLRQCTTDFKIKVIDKYLKQIGAIRSGAAVGIGFSLDEIQRVNTGRMQEEWKKIEYPLIDLHITRIQCKQIIEKAGLPVPPKSSCWFCPYHSMQVWQDMRNSTPDLFSRSVELEQHINRIRERIGKDSVWLSRKLKPLDKATTELVQDKLEFDDFCDTGYCFL